MAAFTAGELKRLYWLEESNYGVTLASTELKYGADLTSFNNGAEPNQEIEQHADSRAYAPASCVITRMDHGFKLKQAQVRAPISGYDWTKPLLYGAMGSAGGFSALGRLPSFSMLTGLTAGATSHYSIYSGCKVNSLSMSCERAGGRVMFEADVMAQYLARTTALALTGFQSKTLGSLGAIPAAAVLQWKAPFVITPSGGSARTVYPEPWTLRINNNLQRAGGAVTGADSNVYTITEQLHEGKAEIELEMKLYLEDLTAINEMLENTAVTSVSTVIGGKTITLGSGHHKVDGNAWPELKQDVMDQTLRFRFSTMTVA